MIKETYRIPIEEEIVMRIEVYDDRAHIFYDNIITKGTIECEISVPRGNVKTFIAKMARDWYEKHHRKVIENT